VSYLLDTNILSAHTKDFQKIRGLRLEDSGVMKPRLRGKTTQGGRGAFFRIIAFAALQNRRITGKLGP
jgi:hypothetical protein